MGNSSDPSVIVVGAGIGGLSLAIALRRQGCQPVVLERAPQLEALGAGITLFPNAMDGLSVLGVAEAVTAAGALSTHCPILTSRGRRLAHLPSTVLDGTVAVHRGDLQAVLLNAAGDLGIEVQAGTEVTSIEQGDEEVIARAANGSEHHGRLLVGADGIWSATRAAVAPRAPSFGGYAAWRGIAPVAIEPGRMIELWGVGERFGLVDIGSRTYWFATANTPAGGSDQANDRRASLMTGFGGWHPDIPRVLDATPQRAILRNDIYYLRPLPRWSEGRIVLLGDAAHATTPGLGQGAGQAIEDAVVLARQIANPGTLDDPEQLRNALVGYEAIRRPRAELTLKLSSRADRFSQLASPLGARLRNLAVALTPSRLQAADMKRLVHPQLAEVTAR